MLQFREKIFSTTNILLFLTLTFSIVLQFIPLTNVIGYEFSIISAFYLFYFSGISTAIFIKKNEQFSDEKKLIYFRRKYYFILLTFIPLLISIMNTVMNSICPIWEGLLFYFVITIPSIMIGGMIAYIISELFNRLTKIIFSIIFIFICLGPITEIYSNPQVYFFNPIIGFFPGNIYDEDISVDFSLIFYRSLNMLFIFGLLFILNFLKQRIKLYKQFTILVTVVIAAGFSLLKPALGFATTDSCLNNSLGARLSTQHFNIIYPKETNDEFAHLLGLHHEYYYEELAIFFEFEPEQKITSYIFKNDDQKKKLFGAGKADVAKPWMNQIYIELDSYDRSLKHELVHVFSAVIGTTPFKIAENFNPAMIEGFAVAVENNYSESEVHFIAALAKKFGFEVKIENLFSGFNFFSGLSTLSYIYSGSFIKYLFENYEKEKVLMLYSDIDFQKYLGKDITQLSNDYSAFIDSLDYQFNQHEANLFFGRKPLFKKICPRYTANMLNTAWKDYNDKNYEKSLSRFSELLLTTESYSALLGKVYSLNRLDKNKEALNELSERIDGYINTSYLYNIEMVLADNYLRNDMIQKSDSLLNTILNQTPSEAHYFASLNRKLLLQLDINKYKSYLVSDNNEKWNILLELNNDKLYIESVFSLISLVQLDNNKMNRLNDLMDKYFIVNDKFTAYIAFQFSKLAVRFSEFENAKYWAEESLKFAPKKYSLIYGENLKIINWFLNFGDNINKRFTINFYD